MASESSDLQCKYSTQSISSILEKTLDLVAVSNNAPSTAKSASSKLLEERKRNKR